MHIGSRYKGFVAAFGLVSAATISAAMATPAYAQEARRQFDIPAQSLASALIEFSRQSDVVVTAPSRLTRGKAAPAVRGSYTHRQTLALLLEGSGLIATPAGNGSWVVTLEGNAQKLETGKSEAAAFAVTDEVSDLDTAQQEILVTGSRIRGIENSSSPLLRFDRAELERTGFATTQQFIQSLPQNVNTVSTNTVGAANGGAGDSTYSGAGINLRGLGGDATLVLLNGRRLAAAGDGSFVDVSLIPLSIIERIDVLTDGASALYGSDAVGGVVNFVLRENFTGAESRLRFGTVTEGKHHEFQAGQVLGYTWGSGKAVGSYEYFQQSPLEAQDRTFFEPRNNHDNFALVPEQKRHSALGIFEQQVSDTLTVTADVFFADRDSASYSLGPAGPIDTASSVTQHGVALGIETEIGNDWQVRVNGLHDRNSSDMTQYYQSYDFETGTRNESDLWSVDFAADGSLFNLPGGNVRMAVGAQFRREGFADENPVSLVKLRRHAAAAYAELYIPVYGKTNSRSGIEKLDLIVAARYEDYSDFGHTFNPKLGLAWGPVSDLNVRATWGTSFKAPRLSQMNGTGLLAIVQPDAYPDTSGPVTGLYIQGNGENLKAETSRNWTVGLDINPRIIPSLALSASYFDIEYKNRISYPLPSGYDYRAILLDPTFTGLVTRDPSQAYVENLLNSSSNVLCFTLDDMLCDPIGYAGQIGAIVDARLRNLAEVRTSGIDFSLSYRLVNALGDWILNVRGAKLLSNRHRLFSELPATNELNQVWRPVDLRMRSSLSYHRGPWDITAALTYTDDYHDNRSPSGLDGAVQKNRVASWSTVDLTLQYDLAKVINIDGIKHLTLLLSGINIFDNTPPYVANAFGLHYDGVNADPKGRFISAQVTARW